MCYRIPIVITGIFSVWDRLFGTFMALPKEEIVYGIDTHRNPKEHNQLKNLLKIPFQKPRSTENN